MDNTQVKAKTFRGTVVSDRMDKTVVVEISRYIKHPRVGKYVSRRKRIKAHDPENVHTVGDVVTIEAIRPIAKSKQFRVVGKVE